MKSKIIVVNLDTSLRMSLMCFGFSTKKLSKQGMDLSQREMVAGV